MKIIAEPIAERNLIVSVVCSKAMERQIYENQKIRNC
jgi:hypothetical protein